eukprot:jgi/Tetstr1/432396/TSEL_021793.t1
MAAELRSLLGTDDVGQAALGLLTGSLAAGTHRNYDSGMRSFATFCEQEGLRPLLATTSTIVRYTAWLGMQGTVGAESLQQYYSSINKYFRDHQRQRVVLGEMVADARRGLAIQQDRLTAEAALTTITAYVFVCRAESGISCETGARPPTGFKWTSHSLRKGAASAASCVGVPLPAIKHMGDWSKNIDVVTEKYIDPTMRPTHAAWRFFGWLVPVQPPAKLPVLAFGFRLWQTVPPWVNGQL